MMVEHLIKSLEGPRSTTCTSVPSSFVAGGRRGAAGREDGRDHGERMIWGPPVVNSWSKTRLGDEC